MIASSRKIPPRTGYGGSTLGLISALWLVSSDHKVNYLLGMDREHSAGATKPFIGTAEKDGPDLVLP